MRDMQEHSPYGDNPLLDDDPDTNPTPDDQVDPDPEQPDSDIDLGTVDDEDPVELDVVPDDEAPEPPDNWQSDAHDEDYADDPDVVVTDDTDGA